MYYMGIDHHKQYSQLTLLDKEGREIKSGRVLNTEREVRGFLEGKDAPRASSKGPSCVRILGTRHVLHANDRLSLRPPANAKLQQPPQVNPRLPQHPLPLQNREPPPRRNLPLPPPPPLPRADGKGYGCSRDRT